MNGVQGYDPERHEYWTGDKRLPSVTEILNEWREIEVSGDTWWYNIRTKALVPGKAFETARDRGSAVHLGALYLLTGRGLKWDELDRGVKNRLLQMSAWQKCFKPQVIQCEQPMFDTHEGFAGTPDIICKISGQREVALIDVKTGEAGLVELQTAAYEHLWRKTDRYRGRVQRWLLELGDEGYSFKPIGRPTDLAHFKVKKADWYFMKTYQKAA